MISKKILIPAVAFAVVAAALFTTSQVLAQEAGGSNTLVAKIAQKFGLNQADVQTVFDQHHQERFQAMQTNYATYLDQLVKDGKITDAQKQLIIAKQKELKDKMIVEKDAFKNMTAEERRAASEQHRKDLENWATQNGIDLSLVRFMHGEMHQFGMHGGWGMKTTPAPRAQ